MVEPLKAPPDERAGNGYVLPNATAPHLDSTLFGPGALSDLSPQCDLKRTSHAAALRCSPRAICTVLAPVSPVPDRQRHQSMSEIKTLPRDLVFQTPMVGGPAMAEYRAYTLGRDEHFIGLNPWFAPMMPRRSTRQSGLSMGRTLSFGPATGSWRG